MKCAHKGFCALFLVATLFMSFSPQAQAASSQEILAQYISDLQKNPNDYALREKIIRHVQTMKPAPAIPDEARRFMNRGMAAAEEAKTEKDYRDAIEEFQKAVNSAPWLGSGYRNLAVVQDKAGLYSQAVQNLKCYLLTNPPTADADAAKTLMDKIEYRQEKKAKESSPETIAKRGQEKSEVFLRNLNGAVFSANLDLGCYGERHTVTIRGNEFVFRSRCYRSTCPDQKHTRVGYEDEPWSGRIKIIGLGHFSVESQMPWQCNEFKVSEDGSKIWLFSGNKKPFTHNPFYRQ
jgi:tetratricopeptide (TPR) repeat protein